MSAKCPYCGFALDPVPKRKKDCPSCGSPIYTRRGKLLTEFDALREDWLVFLAGLNVSKKDFDAMRTKLAARFGQAPGFYDVVWEILNNVVAAAGRPTAEVVQAYREMARVASCRQTDPRPYIASALRASLQVMKMEGTKHVSISVYGGTPDFSTCEACQSLHGAKFSIDEALASLPIPRKCTSETGCRCEYLPLDTTMPNGSLWSFD